MLYFILSKPFPPHFLEAWAAQTTFCYPKPFTPHSWEPWNTQTPFHTSFLAFPNHSHSIFGNHKAPKPFFMVRFSPSEIFPTRFLENINFPNSYSPFQPLSIPLLRKIQSNIRPMNLQTHGKQQTTKNKFTNPKIKKYQWNRSCPTTALIFLAFQNPFSKCLNLKLFLGWVRVPRGPPFYTKN